jgi:hypothetical protein
MAPVCTVLGCKSDYKYHAIQNSYSFFKTTKNLDLEKEAIIPDIRKLKARYLICKKHFKQEFI